MEALDLKKRLQESAAHFRLPRYAEIPNVGLYLEQVTQYINSFLVPMGCAGITPSMISNYVKKGFIEPPHKKQYHADQIAYLTFIAMTKGVLSLENIAMLFEVRKIHYTLPVAYDYFCIELENMVTYVFGCKDTLDEHLGTTSTEEKEFLRHVLAAVAHTMYINACYNLTQPLRAIAPQSKH